jgi:hypothetical protein
MEGFLFLGIFMNINKTNMNHKINIFEELNTIKNMFHYQPGKVISEQDNATNRKYLSEQTLSVDEQIAKEIIGSTLSQLGTEPDRLIKAIQGITGATQFWKVNELVKNNPRNSSKLDIAGVINDEFEYYGEEDGESNKLDLDKIYTKLKSLGIQSTIQKRSSGRYLPGTYTITSQPVVDTKKAAVVDTKKTTVVDPKKDRVKSNTNVKNLAPLTQDIQTSIGSNPSGKLSSQELDSILQRLGGNDASSETSQEVQTTQTFPTDANGKPDLDKILASLSPQQN